MVAGCTGCQHQLGPTYRDPGQETIRGEGYQVSSACHILVGGIIDEAVALGENGLRTRWQKISGLSVGARSSHASS